MNRYDFTFHRCIHCGTTISIHDTEACCDPKAIKMEKSTVVRHTLNRLLRRAGAHGQYPWLVKMEDTQAIVIFMGRTAKIRDDGSIVQDIIPRHMPDGTRRADPQWRGAQENRAHASNMAWAAHCRRSLWIHAARSTLSETTRCRTSAHHD